MPRLANKGTAGSVATRAAIAARLAGEFQALPRKTVERCVDDTWVCTEHVGVHTTPTLVELLAREHLVGVIKGTPPSGVQPRWE